MVGGERITMNSGERRRKGMTRFLWFGTPQLDSFEMSVPGNTAQLLDLSTVEEVTGDGGNGRNSGELHRLGGDDRER
jgi:hypothetical protein